MSAKPFDWEKLVKLRGLLEIFFDKCEIRE